MEEEYPEEACIKCRFWTPHSEWTPPDIQRSCRRFPGWMRRLPGDWCGEFKEKG